MQPVVTWLFVICFACICTLHLAVLYFVAFYPRDAMPAGVIEIATCLSVRLSRAGIVSKQRKLAS